MVKEFVTCEEEEKIINDIDGSAWAESQSGRRKQVRHTVLVVSRSQTPCESLATQDYSLGGKPVKWFGGERQVYLLFFFLRTMVQR